MSAKVAWETNGLLFPAKRPLSFDELEKLWTVVHDISRSLPWWVGDLLVYAEDHHGELFAQLVDATGRDEQTIRTYVRVCRNFPHACRHASLSFGHHRLVAAFPGQQAQWWLKQAVEKRWSKDTLYRELTLRKIGQTFPSLSTPNTHQKPAWETAADGPDVRVLGVAGDNTSTIATFYGSGSLEVGSSAESLARLLVSVLRTTPLDGAE